MFIHGIALFVSSDSMNVMGEGDNMHILKCGKMYKLVPKRGACLKEQYTWMMDVN